MARATVTVLFAALLWASAAHAGGDPEKGRKIAAKHCARCHVVGEFNRLGGIDSTPSFMLLARRQKYLERLETFYLYRPHPVFVRVPGVERWSDAPAYAKEFKVRQQDIDDLVAYVKTLKDWRPPPRRRRR